MNLKQVIDTLHKQGHKVEYSHRKDGGYVIRSIDGVHYKGKQGNAVARLMVGTKLSEARKVQLEMIRTPKKTKVKKLADVSENLKKKLKKIQRIWRKTHPTIEGTQTMGKLRWRIENLGEAKAMESLDKAEKYAMGLAYEENVETLLNRIKMDLISDPNEDMEDIVHLIEEKKDIFREEWIGQIYHVDVLYAWEKDRITGEECARRIRAIIS